MTTHIVCLSDVKDTFSPTIKNSEEIFLFGYGEEFNDRRARENIINILEQKGLTPSTQAIELMLLASSVYFADKTIQRITAFDSWTREIDLYIPVHDDKLWVSQTDLIEKMLNFLTGDFWKVHFRISNTVLLKKPIAIAHNRIKRIALLSGGLDSFCNAIECLDTIPNEIAFVGHHGLGGSVGGSQNRVLHFLQEKYGNIYGNFSFYLDPPISFTAETNGEPTSRSRSFLFLSLGVVTASGFGENKELIIPENGYMSMNIPLSYSRIGSNSTRTTHPYFLMLFQKLLSNLLIKVNIDNPYKFKTKGEVLTGVTNKKFLKEGLHLTISCARSAQGRYFGRSIFLHCGSCLPCLVRRAAIFHAGYSENEYNFDVLTKAASNGSYDGMNLRSLELALARLKANPNIAGFNIIASGPMPFSEVIVREHTAVYIRGMKELEKFISQKTI
jgi:hypothetical protein